MATAFGRSSRGGPGHIASEPQKGQVQNPIGAGFEHRPFSDEEIKQAFDTFDLDKNRFVGASEISHILQVIGEEVTDEEIDEMIRLCDTDGDGQVTFDEFYKLMTNPPPPPPPPTKSKRTKMQQNKAAQYARQAAGVAEAVAAGEPTPGKSGAKRTSPLEQQSAALREQTFRASSVETLVKKLSGGIAKIKPSQIKKVYKRFQDIDVDGSGAIDYDEFIQALEMEDSTIARQMFRVFDMDGSGSIELKEFIVVLSRYTAAAQSEKLKFAFMMFDEDGSGFIERDELLDMLNSTFIVEGLSAEELEEKADSVFDYLGLPRDGAISYEDFLKLSKAPQGFIYPIQEAKKELGKDLSINSMLAQVDA
uniref:EF-hand domain-containing protein n=1 Tax=Zooxanthella nutricula TaxID=1333877 RepID=A0A7S2LSI3_9DINO